MVPDDVLVLYRESEAVGRRGSSRRFKTLSSCGSSSSDHARRKRPKRRDPRVIGDLEHPRSVLAVLVQVLDVALALVRVDVHGAELVDPEPLPARAHALLAEEDWSLGLGLDAQSRVCEER